MSKHGYCSPEDDERDEESLVIEELRDDAVSWERSNDEGWYYDDNE